MSNVITGKILQHPPLLALPAFPDKKNINFKFKIARLHIYPKILITALFIFFSTFLFSQSPPYIPYQAIARDQSGLAKSNTPIQVEFRIYNTMVGSSPAYQELHSITTNDFGYFNLRIGAGSLQSGSFNSISWQTGDVSYEVWIDLGIGMNQLGGRTGFLSVPYALYAGNAAPNPTLNINTPNAVSNVSPGVYSIQVPTPSLSISGYSLSISNGNTVDLPGNYSAGNGISIAGTVISNSQPNQTVSLTGNAVSGTYPSYSVNVLPAFTTSVNPGSNISINGAAPNYTVSAVTPTLTGTGNVNMSGTYPTQTINVTPQTLSITGNNLSLSGNGGNVMLPPTTTVTAGTNVSLNGTAPAYTVNVTTPTLTGTGNANMSGSYPTQTINVTPQILSVAGNNLSLSGNGGSVSLPPSTTITAGSNVLLNGVAPNYTVTAVTPTLTGIGNASVSGVYPNQTISVPPQTLSITGTTLTLSGGGNPIDISNTHWSTSGNAPALTSNDFLGTTNNTDLAVRTNSLERLRITATGSIGIGTQSPAASFDVNTGNIKLGATSNPFSIILHGTAQKTNFSISLLASSFGTLSVPGALVGDMLILTLNDHTATGGALTLSNAWVSAAGVVSYYLSSSITLGSVTANFSYIILRP